MNGISKCPLRWGEEEEEEEEEEEDTNDVVGLH
jgi:hypothetical protein